MNKDWVQSTDSQQVPASEPESVNPVVNLTDVSLKVSKDLVAAAGFNVETPIVDALIGNIKGTLPTKKSEVTETIRCDICDCEISSNVILDFHINGSRHKKRLKALEIIAQLKAGGEKGVHVGDGDDPNSFRCEVCCLTVNSAQQLEFHLSGAKHKKKAAKAGLVEPEPNNGTNNSEEVLNLPKPKKKKKDEPKVLNCDICNVTMNSQIQYDQHLTSKKHMLKSNPSFRRKLEMGERNRFVKFKNKGQHQNFPSSDSNNGYQNNSNQFNFQNKANKPHLYSNFVSSNPNNSRNSYNSNNSNNDNNDGGNNFSQSFKSKFPQNNSQYQKGLQFRNNFAVSDATPPYLQGPGFTRNSNF